MRHGLAALLFALIGPSLPAQGTEWVANGSFTGTLAPWVMAGGYSVNPGLETAWDTTGRGSSESFGVNAGGQTFPGPYAPNTIEQTIQMVQGLTYEFRADASGARPLAPTVNNADIGTIWVEVDNVEIARLPFGSYTNNGQPGGEVKRAQICGRFTPATTGPVTLRIFFQRQYLGGSSNPRMNLDNVSIRDTSGPTYWVEGNRKIGTTLLHQVRGPANTLFGAFVALGENPAGLAIPGFNGLWYLDLASSTAIGSGLLDALGAGGFNLTIPNNPLFVSTPLYYQAVSVYSQIDFGYSFVAVCSQ